MYRRMNPKQLEELIKKLVEEKTRKEAEMLKIERMKKSTAPPLLDRP